MELHREKMNENDFLAAIAAGRTDFSKALFTSDITLDKPGTSGEHVFEHELCFDDAEFMGDVSLGDVNCQVAITFWRAKVHKRLMMYRIKTPILTFKDGKFAQRVSIVHSEIECFEAGKAVFGTDVFLAQVTVSQVFYFSNAKVSGSLIRKECNLGPAQHYDGATWSSETSPTLGELSALQSA
jgi:hypothetical protein